MITRLDIQGNVEKIISDVAEEIIGDTPVSVQLATALNGMASKEDVNALSSEMRALRKEVEKLIELVGDTSVSEQINNAINKPEN